ncbi:MAG: GIY-YIG nuclease family protein [Patescibacteria group bacterium]
MLECADRSLYIGYTKDVEKRLHAHNHLKSGAKYTKQRRPVRLVYSEIYRTLRQALRREYEMKQLSRAKKLLLKP